MELTDPLRPLIYQSMTAFGEQGLVLHNHVPMWTETFVSAHLTEDLQENGFRNSSLTRLTQYKAPKSSTI